jgi:hypothetical protein
MVSKSRLEAKKAQAQADMAASMKELNERQDMMFEWLAQGVVAIDERLKAIEAALDIEFGIQSLPPDGEEGEGTPPTPEPEKKKRGRPRKVKS